MVAVSIFRGARGSMRSMVRKRSMVSVMMGCILPSGTLDDAQFFAWPSALCEGRPYSSDHIRHRVGVADGALVMLVGQHRDRLIHEVQAL